MIDGETEFLDSTHYDTRAILQSLCQLLGSTTDVINSASLFLEGLHIIGQIPVKHDSVSYQNDTVKDWSIVRIHHIAQLMSQPSHRFRLS